MLAIGLLLRLEDTVQVGDLGIGGGDFYDIGDHDGFLFGVCPLRAKGMAVGFPPVMRLRTKRREGEASLVRMSFLEYLL
jgi:hypothetical protein